MMNPDKLERRLAECRAAQAHRKARTAKAMAQARLKQRAVQRAAKPKPKAIRLTRKLRAEIADAHARRVDGPSRTRTTEARAEMRLLWPNNIDTLVQRELDRADGVLPPKGRKKRAT